MAGLSRNLARSIAKDINDGGDFLRVTPIGGGGGDVSFASVVLLADMDGDAGAAETDASNSAHPIVFSGTATLSTARGASRTGQTTSLLLNGGSSDRISVVDSDDFHFGSGDFTIEVDLNADAAWNGSNNFIMACRDTGVGGLNLWSVDKIAGGTYGSMRFIFRDSTASQSNSAAISAVATPAAGEWHTFSVSRQGTSVYLHFDGALLSTIDASGWSAMATSNPPDLYIGTNTSTTFDEWDGAVGNVRITKGVGRYGSSSYTVSPDPYPTS